MFVAIPVPVSVVMDQIAKVPVVVAVVVVDAVGSW